MSTAESYDILCIGNYTKDTIISPAGVTYVDGGAVNYAAHASRCLGLKVAVVTRLAEEDQRVVQKFNQIGVDCFVTYTPHSTCMELEYPTLDPDIRNLSVAYTAGTITAGEVNRVKAQAAVIGTSLRGEIAEDVIPSLKSQGVLLAADIQGFVRVLRGKKLIFEPWEEMPKTLAYLDILKSDAVEAEFLTGEKDIYRAAKIYAQMGPKEIVLTHKDGVLIYTESGSSEVGFYPSKMNGRSGRGDTCIGAYVSMRLSLPPSEAGIWAAAVTSLKMENLGPFNRSIAEIEALIRSRYGNNTVDEQAAAN